MEVKVPQGLKIGYIMGAGDDIPDVLRELGLNVTIVTPEELASGDLSRYGTFDNEYDLLPATQTAAKTMASQNAMFAAFLNNISSSVNYPTNTNWGTVDSAIEQQVGAAINGSPSQVLNTLQQTASSGS